MQLGTFEEKLYHKVHLLLQDITFLCTEMIVMARSSFSEYKIHHSDLTAIIGELFKAIPLEPIGCLVTAYFLGSGIHSFYNHDPKKSQKMKRLCTGSQFMTILIFVGYAGMNAFTLQLTPHAGSCVNL